VQVITGRIEYGYSIYIYDFTSTYGQELFMINCYFISITHLEDEK
jgi:hypothetical protein